MFTGKNAVNDFFAHSLFAKGSGVRGVRVEGVSSRVDIDHKDVNNFVVNGEGVPK